MKDIFLREHSKQYWDPRRQEELLSSRHDGTKTVLDRSDINPFSYSVKLTSKQPIRRVRSHRSSREPPSTSAAASAGTIASPPARHLPAAFAIHHDGQRCQIAEEERLEFQLSRFVRKSGFVVIVNHGPARSSSAQPTEEVIVCPKCCEYHANTLYQDHFTSQLSLSRIQRNSISVNVGAAVRQKWRQPDVRYGYFSDDSCAASNGIMTAHMSSLTGSSDEVPMRDQIYILIQM